MSERSTKRGEDFPLTADCRMLLQIRETLYEGSWEDFEQDLKARARGGPHVFETIHETPGMKATIAVHLQLIDDMRRWESVHKTTLRG